MPSAVYLLPLLLLLLRLVFVSASAPSASMASADRYRYAVQLASSDAPLLLLASYALGAAGSFDIALDVTLTIDAPDADRGRTMLHLLVCDAAAVDRFTHPPLAGRGARVSDRVPAFCAMANETLGDLCESYPLVDESKDAYVYRVQQTLRGAVEGSAAASSSSSRGDDRLFFYLDACETVGGDEGVLRSCLQEGGSRPPSSHECFFCPKNFPLLAGSSRDPACSVPPAVRPTLYVQAAMNLCTRDGACLSSGTAFLAAFYLALAVAWAVTWAAWAAHIRASREAVVSLQTKMKLVPAAMCVYAALTCVVLSTDELLVGTARKLVVHAAILSQVLALAVPAEVVVLIAKGWKITRGQLDPREHQYIRFVTLAWAISYTVLKNSVAKHLTVFLVWGVSWSSVVFMIWYNSAFNLNMLLYQIAMVRQMQLDPTRTPVYTKYMLFRRFRALLGAYMFVSCVIAVLGLVGDAANDRWQWGAAAADELLSFALYVAMGYAFRCRRFSNLIQAPASATRGVSTSTAAAGGAGGGPPSPTPTSTQAASASVAPSGTTPLPRIEGVPRPKSSMVLVVNPIPHEQSLGTSYEPVNPKAGKASAKGGGAASCAAGGSGQASPKKDRATQ